MIVSKKIKKINISSSYEFEINISMRRLESLILVYFVPSNISEGGNILNLNNILFNNEVNIFQSDLFEQ